MSSNSSACAATAPQKGSSLSSPFTSSGTQTPSSSYAACIATSASWYRFLAPSTFIAASAFSSLLSNTFETPRGRFMTHGAAALCAASSALMPWTTNPCGGSSSGSRMRRCGSPSGVAFPLLGSQSCFKSDSPFSRFSCQYCPSVIALEYAAYLSLLLPLLGFFCRNASFVPGGIFRH